MKHLVLNMTPKKRKILDYIKIFQAKKRYSPTVSELARHFKVSTPTMWQHLEDLKAQDLIDRRWNEKRYLAVLEAPNPPVKE